MERPSYDVFISFKNLDAAGRPTRDAELARQLYERLTVLGVRAFLSTVSLEATGQSAYKAGIDAALDSCRVLIAVGTSAENLDSEWVKYEWDSFFNDIISGLKPNGRTFVLTEGVAQNTLPRPLRQSQAFMVERDELDRLSNFVLRALSDETGPLPQPQPIPRPRLKQDWRMPALGGAAIAIVLLAGVGGMMALTGGKASPTATPTATAPAERQPSPTPGALTTNNPPMPSDVLAPPIPANRNGTPTIDGLVCARTESTTYHLHPQLLVFNRGLQMRIPYGIGIAPPLRISDGREGPFVESGSCFYGLHTHTEDGLIHVEVSAPRNFTLGNFFNVWGVPLNSNQVGPVEGTVFAYVNGRQIPGNPAPIPLRDDDLIQLNVGTNFPAPLSYNPYESGRIN